ncbi:MAG: Rpp14/Pop5 family protein [Candidatus Hydrothermarchaeales archaeon]
MTLLHPTLRVKKRYIAFRVHSDAQVKREEVVGAIWHTVLGFLGEKAASELDLWIKDFDHQQGFLVCNRKKVGDVIGCLTLVNETSHKKASIEVLGVSGTLKALKRKFLNTYSKVNEIEKEIEIDGKEMTVVRKYNNFLDAVTEDNELKKRLSTLKMDYIGLTDDDLL